MTSIGAMPQALAKREWVIRLLEAYGRLLTAHQQRLLRLYYLDDLSLSEIAGRLRVTRQAVFDGLDRAVVELARVEAALGLVRVRVQAQQRRHAVERRLTGLAHAVNQLDGRIGPKMLTRLTAALTALRRALE